MKTLFRLCLFCSILIVLLLTSHLLLKHNSAIFASQVISNHHWAFLGWRYSFYAFVLIMWPVFIKKIGVKQKWPQETILQLSKQRFKLIGLFACIKAFFVYNLLGHLLAWL